MVAKRVMEIAKEQLAIDLNCAPGDLDREGFVFTLARENTGRRPFPRGKRHLEMLTMGRAVVVSASDDLLPMLKERLAGASREDAFAQPFVYGHSLYYLPDADALKPVECPEGFALKTVERPDIPALYALPGFANALQYDIAHARPDVLAVTAARDGAIVGIAGASLDSETMWQVGIDVLPACRNRGLAAALVSRLSMLILGRGCVPYYGTASCNIPSQRVAFRAGFAPAWMCCYRGVFDGKMTEPTS